MKATLKLVSIVVIIFLALALYNYISGAVTYPDRLCSGLAHGQPFSTSGSKCIVDNGYGKDWEVHDMNPAISERNFKPRWMDINLWIPDFSE